MHITLSLEKKCIYNQMLHKTKINLNDCKPIKCGEWGTTHIVIIILLYEFSKLSTRCHGFTLIYL